MCEELKDVAKITDKGASPKDGAVSRRRWVGQAVTCSARRRVTGFVCLFLRTKDGLPGSAISEWVKYSK